MSKRTFDVITIGGGLHGLSAALHIARKGLSVLLVERSWTGRHASGANAAGVRTSGRHLAELPISLEAMQMWPNMRDLVDDDCGFKANGHLKVAESPKELQQLVEKTLHLNQLGYNHEVVINQDELRELAPHISSHCIGAVYANDNGAADPHRTLLAFRNAAEKAGVEIRQQTAVVNLERRGATWLVRAGEDVLEAPYIVNAAGAWGSKIAALVGDEIPLATRASMMTVTERIAPFVKPTVTAVGTQGSFKQTDRGTFLIGGGFQGAFDLDAETTTVEFLGLVPAARNAIKLFPKLRDVKIARTWGGLEACTADRLPIIAPSDMEGVVHVFGFSGHGFQLVPVVGAIVADLVLNGRSARPIDAFHHRRLIKKSTTQ